MADRTTETGTQQAYPHTLVSRDVFGNLHTKAGVGLTKRELFAAMAMQAILTGAVTRACPSNEWVDQRMAVKCADELLAELERTRE